MLARLRGFRTLAVLLPVVLLGILDQLGTVDLKSFLALVGVPEDRMGGVMAAIGLVAIALRVMTTTPIGQAPAPKDQG